MKQGQVFGVSASDAIDGAEFSHSIRRADRADAFDASVAVSGVGCVEFVAATDPANLRIQCDRVVDWKRKVAGNSENVGDTDGMQTGEDMLYHSRCHCELQIREDKLKKKSKKT
jgi:hypothetical protein